MNEMGDNVKAMEYYNDALDIYVQFLGHNHVLVSVTKVSTFVCAGAYV